MNPVYTGLYSWDNVTPNTELMELTIAVVGIITRLPGTVSHGSFERQLLLESLNTLAMSLYYGVGNMGEEEAYHLVPVTPTDPTLNPFPWMKWLLSSFKAEMHDPTFSTLIISMMGLWVISQLHTTLYCPLDKVGMAELVALQDPVLTFLGCGLLGWDYVPEDDNPIWESALWKLAVQGRCYSGVDDNHMPFPFLLLALSRRKATFFDDCVLEYIQWRVRNMVSHFFIYRRYNSYQSSHNPDGGSARKTLARWRRFTSHATNYYARLQEHAAQTRTYSGIDNSIG